MPVRTLNYTGRKRILREHAQISVDADRLEFDADLSLSAYEMDGSAHVVVEAYRNTLYQRFDFGTLGQVKKPGNRDLSRFHAVDGVLFRVKVISSDTPGLLLAEADKIRPVTREEEDEDRQELLTVVPDEDLKNEVWRLVFDDDRVQLNVSICLGEDFRALAKDRRFATLVYPSVLRTVLWRILVHEGHRDMEDAGDWRSQWLLLANGLTGLGPMPAEGEVSAAEQWIDDATRAFCRDRHIGKMFKEAWE